MKKCLSAAILVLAMTATYSAAQISMGSVVAKVPFGFFVSGKMLPAGTYRFAASNNLAQINVSAADGKEAALTTVLTRLSPRSGDEASVVFDKAGDNHYLAEIYIPGLDGFQVPCAPGPHTHVSVKGRQ